MANGWKITAIIFIILFIIETIFLIWAYNIGSNQITNEKKCSINVCTGPEYDAFLYSNNECDCYKNGVIIKTEYLE